MTCCGAMLVRDAVVMGGSISRYGRLRSRLGVQGSACPVIISAARPTLNAQPSTRKLNHQLTDIVRQRKRGHMNVGVVEAGTETGAVDALLNNVCTLLTQAGVIAGPGQRHQATD